MGGEAAAPSSSPDATFADASKPYPGGAVAPGADWGGDDEYWVEGSSNAVCREPLLSVFARETTAAVQYVLEGKIYKETSDGPQTALVCSGHRLRILAKSGADIQCEDLMIDPDCGFSGSISIPPAAKVLYYYSTQVIVAPKPSPTCAEVTESDPFIALGNHVKLVSETPLQKLPVCRAEVRSKSDADSEPAPWGGVEIKKPL